MIPGDREDWHHKLLAMRGLLIPGDGDINFDSSELLVFDNHSNEREVITLAEAEKKRWEVSDLEIVALALKDFPMNMLSYEVNPASCERGWHAPKGYAIKIEGSFSITQTEHTQGCGNFGPPCPSKELFPKSRGCEKKFNEFLMKANGDKKKAFRKLLHYIREEQDAGYTLTGYYPEFFIGK
ncbi:MAG: hypothetical protein HQK77_17685 [Desulfobacterales bacterium]|nr:hypothetical protein [Desulfobacterales bacterium]